MNVHAQTSEDGKEVTISTQTRFDFNAHKEFRDTYSSCDPSCKFIVDMKNTTYMDSSALGMLLLLREYAGSSDADIEIINCDDEILKVLQISNFEQLFKIS